MALRATTASLFWRPPTVLNPFDPVDPSRLLNRRYRWSCPIYRAAAKKVEHEDNIDFWRSPAWPPALPGAELANIVNEAALRAVRDGRTKVTQSDLRRASRSSLPATRKKNAILTDHEKWDRLPYHEIGHALVAACQSHSAPVQKITIIPPHLRRFGLHHAGGMRATTI